MDQELFIIEVLSAKQKLSRKRKKERKRINVQAFLSLVFSLVCFFRSCIVPISPYECSSPFS